MNVRLLARYELRPLLAGKILLGAIALPIVAFLATGAAFAPRAAWASAAFVGLGGVAGSMLLFFTSLSRVGATRTIVLFSTMGLWGALAAWAFLGEPLTWVHLFGAALMTGGVIAFARAAP